MHAVYSFVLYFLIYETKQIILLTFFSLTICPDVLFIPIQINLSHSFNYCIIYGMAIPSIITYYSVDDVQVVFIISLLQ